MYGDVQWIDKVIDPAASEAPSAHRPAWRGLPARRTGGVRRRGAAPCAIINRCGKGSRR